MHIHHGRVENVPNNGAGSGHIAGSTALEHHLLTGVAMEIDRVKGAVHRGQGMILRQEVGRTRTSMVLPSRLAMARSLST